MNNNIRIIAEQVANQSKLYCANPINIESEQYHFFVEVFTEYLIKEIIQQCYKHIVTTVSSDDSAHNSAVEKCVKSIKEYSLS